jgi:hypothetical protein
MLLETIARKLKSEFPSLHFAVDEEKYLVVIPPIHKEYGNIEIEDDGDEFIVMVGKFTHWHAGCYREDFSERERAEAISDDVIDFLREIFDDKIVTWGSHNGGGGFMSRDALQSDGSELEKHQKWFWSGPF